MKMALDSSIVPLVASNFDLVWDMKFFLSLVCFIPMLEIVNLLVKFAQLLNGPLFVARMKIF